MTKPNTRSNILNKNGEQKESSTSATTQQEALFNLIDEENPTLKDVYKILKGMSHSLSFLAEGYDDFKVKIKNLESENNNLKNETEKLHKRLQYLENDYYTEQQHKLQNYVTIHGIPQQKNEETMNTIIKIASTLQVNITPTSIKTYRKMNNHNNTNPTPIIIVEFHDLEIKQALQASYKKNGPIITSQILSNSDKTISEHKKIYLNDYLCTYIKQLLDQTKKIQVQCKIKYVWTKNGCVYARYNDNTPVIKIKNYNNITELELEATN